MESSIVKSVNKGLSEAGWGVDTAIKFDIILKDSSCGFCEQNTGHFVVLASNIKDSQTGEQLTDVGATIVSCLGKSLLRCFLIVRYSNASVLQQLLRSSLAVGTTTRLGDEALQ